MLYILINCNINLTLYINQENMLNALILWKKQQVSKSKLMGSLHQNIKDPQKNYANY